MNDQTKPVEAGKFPPTYLKMKRNKFPLNIKSKLKQPRLATNSKHFDRWYSMIDRCYNAASANYCYYGARGISVCRDWMDYSKFQEWCNKTYIAGRTLDRVDNNGNYTPENCRWATRSQQSKNTRVTPKRRKHLSRASKIAVKSVHDKFGDPKTRKKKNCSSCKTVFPFNKFNKNRTSVDGYNHVCRDCFNLMQTKRRNAHKASGLVGGG